MKRPLKTALLYVPVLIVVAIQVFPVLLILLTSFRKQVSLLQHGPFSLDGLFWGNYRQVLVTDEFLRYMGTSSLVALASTLISIATGSLAAYALTRFSFWGRKSLSVGILCARIIPPVALAVPLFLLLKQAGLTDTLAGLVLAHTTINLPFAIWLMMPFFESLPRELEEAAEMDGCSKLQVFRIIFLPLALPGLMVAGIFCFLLSWNDFLFSLILAGSDTKTAPLVVNGYMTGFGPEWGPMTASSMLIMFPVFLFSLLLQKHIVAGLSAGGVKG
jgi:multiple sugar transport system permease protein